MRRLPTLAWALGVSLLGSAASAADPPSKAVTWPETIDVGTWKYLTHTDTTVFLNRPSVVAGPYRRMWTREESKEPEVGAMGSYQSSVWLTEYDCAQGRSRVLQYTFYGAANMQGGMTGTKTPDAPSWRFEVPGTIGEAEMDAACA